MIWCCEMQALVEFIKTAKPLDMFKYYEGLSLDQTKFSEQIGIYAYNESAKGLIYLVRKRENSWTFHYYAIKASKKYIERLRPLTNEEFNKLYRISTGGTNVPTTLSSKRRTPKYGAKANVYQTRVEKTVERISNERTQ